MSEFSLLCFSTTLRCNPGRQRSSVRTSHTLIYLGVRFVDGTTKSGRLASHLKICLFLTIIIWEKYLFFICLYIMTLLEKSGHWNYLYFSFEFRLHRMHGLLGQYDSRRIDTEIQRYRVSFVFIFS